MKTSNDAAFDVHTFEDAIKFAEDNDLVVKLPEPNQLFIDIDSLADLGTFHGNYGLIDQYVGIEGFVITESRNGGEGKHIVVTLSKNITLTERCLLQAILGSDLRREAHGFWRIMQGSTTPTLFFEKGVGEDEDESNDGEGDEILGLEI